MRLTGGHYLYNLSTKQSQFCTRTEPMCSGGDLTPGTYRVTVSDKDSAHPALRPLSVTFQLRR
jgi:hypothetical protein